MLRSVFALFVEIVEENAIGGFITHECFLKECMECIAIMLKGELKKYSLFIFGFQISLKDLFKRIQFLWKTQVIEKVVFHIGDIFK